VRGERGSFAFWQGLDEAKGLKWKGIDKSEDR
jgi:hypothetical protein